MIHCGMAFKTKVASHGTVFKILLLKKFSMETRLSNIFKFTNVRELIKAILKSSPKLLQVICKWRKIKQPVYFVMVVEFSSTFDIQMA